MKETQIYLVPTSSNFKLQLDKNIDLQSLVFVPLLSGFDFEYEILDMDLLEFSNQTFYVKVKILKLSH